MLWLRRLSSRRILFLVVASSPLLASWWGQEGVVGHGAPLHEFFDILRSISTVQYPA